MRYEQAIHIYKKGLEYGNNYVLLNNLSVKFRMKGMYDEAQDILNQFKLAPGEDDYSHYYDHYSAHKRDIDSLVELTNQMKAGLISEQKYIQEKEKILEKYGGK